MWQETKSKPRKVHFHLQSTERDVKFEDITNEIVEQLMTSCAECSSHIIDKQSFACYAESPNHVTFRARLEGTPERGSGSLISLIDKWVSDGAGISVTGVLMTVDPKCSVAISSLGEGECLPPPAVSPTTVDINPKSVTVATDPSTASSTTSAIKSKSVTLMIDPPSTMNPEPSVEVMDTSESTDQSSSSPDNTPAIIGAVVAIVVILIIAISLTIIAIAALKYRHRNLSLKHAEK